MSYMQLKNFSSYFHLQNQFSYKKIIEVGSEKGDQPESMNELHQGLHDVSKYKAF